MNFALFGRDSDAILAAMDRSQAIIEFSLDGKILKANENFCRALNYELREIVGQHHRMFVDPAEASSPAYAEFWRNLASGKFDRAQYKRIGKGGKEIWIEASYNPVFRGGKPYKVVKFATDITAQKLKAAEDAGKLDALSRAQAVIEFTPNGDILTANENFLTWGSTTRCSARGSTRQPTTIAASGSGLLAANSLPMSSCESVRAAKRSTSKPPTIRFST